MKTYFFRLSLKMFCTYNFSKVKKSYRKLILVNIFIEIKIRYNNINLYIIENSINI